MSQLESEYQVSLTHVKNQHNNKISCMREKLTEYRVSLTHIKNQHNKKISCVHEKLSALEASVDKKDSDARH